jgi:hypothetical protein
MTERQRKYIKERVKGKTKKEAALAAGYSPTTALRTNRIETPNVRKAFAEIIRNCVPGELIGRRIREGLDAVKTEFFSSDGIVTDQRETVAWSERREYAKLAAEYGGYFTPQVEVSGAFVHVLTPAEKHEAEECVKRLIEYDREEESRLLVEVSEEDGRP